MTDGSAPESKEILSATTGAGAGRPQVIPQAEGQSEVSASLFALSIKLTKTSLVCRNGPLPLRQRPGQI